MKPIRFYIAPLVLLCGLLVFCSTPSGSPPTPTPADASAAPPTFEVPRRHTNTPQAPPLTQAPAPAMSPEVQARAACSAADGSWRCAGKAVKPMAAAAAQPIFPTAWTVPQWFIDKQNTTACASDSNSGTAATCTGGCAGSVCTSGIGPLRTFQELNVHRWGCFGNPRACPRLRQDTIITHVSNDTNGSDPEAFYNTLENGASLFVRGTITAVNSSSLSGTVPKNRATPQLLTTNLGFAATPGALLINSTHASHARVYKNTGGTNFSISQPLAPTTLPAAASPPPNEVDTWANLDTVNIYSTTAVNVVDLRPVLVDYNGGFSNGDFLVQLTTFDPSGVGDDNIYIGPHVASYDVQFDRGPMIVESTYIDVQQAFVNCYFDAGFNGGPQNGQQMLIDGGVLMSNAVEYNFSEGTLLDGDIIFDPAFGGFPVGFPNGLDLGLVYIASTRTLRVAGGVSFLNSVYAAPILWGPGNVEVDRNGTLVWDSGLHTATSIFLLTGTIKLNGSVGALCPTGATAVNNAGTAITGALLDAPCAAGTGYGGTAYNVGRASIVGGI